MCVYIGREKRERGWGKRKEMEEKGFVHGTSYVLKY